MEDLTNLLDILSTTGTVLSVLTCLAPLPAVYSAFKTRKLEGVDIEYMFLSKVTNFAWLVYEFEAGELGAIPSSLLAYLLFGFYLLVCARVSGEFMKSIIQQLLTEAFLLLGTKLLFDLESMILLTFVLTSSCYISPLAGLYTIVKEKQMHLIDLNIAVAILLSNSVWTVYFALKDVLLLSVANFLGVVFAVLTLGVYFWLRKNKLDKVSRFSA